MADPVELTMPALAPDPATPLTSGGTAWMQSFAETGPVDVSVCIVNWNGREMLRTCLESLHDQPQGVRLETLVVDNGSTDGAADMVGAFFRKSS